MQVTAMGVLRDEGTVIVFTGRPSGDDYSDNDVMFIVDRRMAKPILDRMCLVDECEVDVPESAFL